MQIKFQLFTIYLFVRHHNKKIVVIEIGAMTSALKAGVWTTVPLTDCYVRTTEVKLIYQKLEFFTFLA